MPNVVTTPCDEGMILAEESQRPCTRAEARWVLAATILASSMAFIDGTVVNVALPALQNHLQATAIGVQWVIEAYALFLSALLLVGGSLGDHYGRKKVFVTGVSLFAVASAWCGLAPNIAQLIAARAAQGIGAALLVPGSLAIISASFDKKDRGRAIGTWSGFSAITTAIGPVLGGWLVDHVSWRSVFFLNLPLAVIVISISLWRVPETRDLEATGRPDWLGAAVVTLGLGALVFGLIESSRLTLMATAVIASISAGIVLLISFLLIESRIENPMLPLRLFRSRTFTGANLLTLLLYFSLGAGFFFLTLNLIQVQGFSATAAGSALLPFVLIMFGLSRWSGGLLDRIGPRLPLTIGPLVASAGFALFALPSINASYWRFVPAVLVLGLGMAISVAPLTTTVMESVAEKQAGIASGINNAVARTAGLLAIAVLGVVMLGAFSDELVRQLSFVNVPEETRQVVYDQRIKLGGIEIPDETLAPDQIAAIDSAIKRSFVSGFREIMFIASALAALGALTSWLLIRRIT